MKVVNTAENKPVLKSIHFQFAMNQLQSMITHEHQQDIDPTIKPVRCCSIHLGRLSIVDVPYLRVFRSLGAKFVPFYIS